MNLLRILAWTLILVLVLAIVGYMFRDVNPFTTILPHIGNLTTVILHPVSVNTTPTSTKVYVYNQSYKEFYNLGLNTKINATQNLTTIPESTPFLFPEKGNDTFSKTILNLLKLDAWHVKPREYQIIVDIANFFNVKPVTNVPNATPTQIRVYGKKIIVLPNETAYILTTFPSNATSRNVSVIVLKLKKLNTTHQEFLPYVPSSNVTLYNYSWIEDYTLVYGWYSQFDFDVTWDSLSLRMTPTLVITNGTHTEYINESTINKYWNLTGKTGTWSYTYEGCYYKGYGPLFHFSFKLVKTDTSMYFEDWTFKTRYLYFEKWNYTFYPLLEVYNGKHPLFAKVLAKSNGTELINQTYNVTASPYCYPDYGYCWAYTPFSLSLNSTDFTRKIVNYTVTLYDQVSIGNYSVRREYKSLELSYSYEVEGDLPDWNDYSFITIKAKPLKVLLRQSPPWAHDTSVKLNDDYLSKYLLYVESKWINNSITDFLQKINSTRKDFDSYILYSQLGLNIYPTKENYTTLSREALKSLLEKKGNATAVNYLIPLLFGLGNYVHVDNGTLKWYGAGSKFKAHEGYILYTLLEKIPDYYSNYSYIGTGSSSRIHLVDLVYQKSPVGIWIWMNETGYLESLIDPLHDVGERLQFYKGFKDYPFECVLDSKNITIAEYNITILKDYLKTAKNYDQFKRFI